MPDWRITKRACVCRFFEICVLVSTRIVLFWKVTGCYIVVSCDFLSARQWTHFWWKRGVCFAESQTFSVCIKCKPVEKHKTNVPWVIWTAHHIPWCTGDAQILRNIQHWYVGGKTLNICQTDLLWCADDWSEAKLSPHQVFGRVSPPD